MNEPGLNDQAMPGDTGREQPVPASPGARLAAGRQERGWTIEQVAGQLNLAPRQVIALEADDYPSLPGMATARGFVRQYAKLLKIDAAPLLASLGGETMVAQELVRPRQNLSTPFSEARLPSMNARTGGGTAKWIVAGVAIAAIGAVVFALQQGVDFAGMSQSASSQVRDGLSQINTPSAPDSQGASTPPAPDSVSASPEPVNAQPPLDPAAASDPRNPAQPAQSTAQGAADDSPAQQSASPAVPATTAAAAAPSTSASPADGANSLVIRVRQDSWVEVRSAGGKPLIARVVKAGETETFDVTDPVAVVIGNASGVDATLRGTPVELKAPGNGNVARLTLK
ncbi:DUF4115 domain-containing protein [Noviherbaspirillum sp. CPCC 100848]|uniref:DUF4115 domain-containing protein n=1 Tax=Noviherbaspirillum album TaxID=3080276 RepID=A0ABU6JCR4_9BURK|nr:RodZ domain-containing protein [Noviherbaspirillum sp. CPCC 100848]MEC4721429.1 DUF4115 domain-containing protein [Noviherbaspirillum sp. CPCC 100848]